MRRVLAMTVLALVVGALAVVHASSPRFWQVSTQAAFLRGEVDGLSIDSDGRLRLGPVVRPLYDATVPFIWTLVAGPDGAIYAGSGNDGQVFRIDRQGKASVFTDTPEMEVHALAFAPDGTLYVGTSPDGKIYKVDKAGTATPFFDPSDKYIWSLAVDREGRVYAGTGEKGLIYRIAPDGKGDQFFNTRTTHVTALAWDTDGRLLAGTESPGRVLRIDGNGKGFVLLDSGYREIHAVRVGPDGTIYAAAINDKPSTGAAAPVAIPETPRAAAPTPSVSTEITSVTVIEAPVTAAADQRPSRQGQEAGAPKGAVYRIDAGGGWEVIWDSREDIPYDVAIDGPNAVLVATGNAGKIYRVAGDPWRSTLLLRAGGQQVTALLGLDGSRRILATSNPAKIAELPGQLAAQGTYTSEVKDAGMVATWGTLSWRGLPDAASHIQVFSRTGNSETPDDTWSPWAGPYEHADGDAVKNPPARYFQWKAAFTGGGAAPVLTSLTIGYLQRNVRPKVSAITVHPPGVVFQRPFSSGELEIAGYADASVDAKLPAFSMPLGTPQSPNAGPALGRRIYQKGLQAFVWRAEDDNDDQLVYDVLYRREDDAGWTPLKRGYTDAVLVWDTTSVPDGTYLVRVVASDRPSNPAAQALSGELDSAAFEIDNTPPTITTTAVERTGARTRVTFEVHDGHSPISHAEYSVDGGAWTTVYPVDGVADARTERYEVTVDGNAAGRIVLRAADTMDNAATSRVEAPASGKR